VHLIRFSVYFVICNIRLYAAINYDCSVEIYPLRGHTIVHNYSDLVYIHHESVATYYIRMPLNYILL